MPDLEVPTAQNDFHQLQQDLDLVRDQLDALQVRLDREATKWYRKFSNWTALIAILFSSYTLLREKYADVQARKTEVRSVMNELISLADVREQQANSLRQEPTNSFLAAIASLLTHGEQQTVPVPQRILSTVAEMKRRMLLEEAELLGDQIPEYLTSSQFMLLANENAMDGDFDDAMRFANSSISAAATDYSTVGAWRCLAGMYFARWDPGDLEQMRSAYQAAEKLLAEKTGDFQLYTQANTYHVWSLHERMKGDTARADDLRAKAIEHLRQTTMGDDPMFSRWAWDFDNAIRFRQNVGKNHGGITPLIPQQLVPAQLDAIPATYVEPADPNNTKPVH